MKIKVIGCAIFEWMVKEHKNNFDCVFLEIAQHDYPDELRESIQKEINASKGYDAIFLLYGLCGNAIMNVTSPHCDLYLFRAHDCSAILLGSNAKQLNQRWSCFSLKKENSLWGATTFKEMEEQYGEHAQYLWDILYGNNEIGYITFHREEDEEAKIRLEKQGKKITKYFEGTKEVVDAMLSFTTHEMVVKLEKGQRIKAVYGDEIIRPI